MDLNNFYQELDCIFQKKDITAAEKYILENMEYAKAEKNISAIASMSNELGGIYRVTNRFEQAKNVYTLALETIKSLGLENTEQHGTMLLNLASVYSESKEYEEALRLYEQVAIIFGQFNLGKDYRMAALYNNISHVYDKLNQEDKALRSAEQSLEIIKQLADYKVELATTLTTLALRYIKIKRYEEAEKNLRQAELTFKTLPGKLDVHFAATLNALGELYYIKGNPNLATQYFKQALDIIKANYGENSSYQEVAKNLDKVKTRRVTGIEFAEEYYLEFGKKMIQDHFPDYEKYMAIGLVGEGSECLGFDDEISEDHDFNLGFCIWLPDTIFEKIGSALKKEYEALPKTSGSKFSIETLEGKGRTGVFSVNQFYKKYIGCPGIPQNNLDWLLAPEINLSTATNGKVFQDNYGEFTQIRNQLLNFYPRDIFLKKLAARMAQMSQHGQYNYERCMKRGDYAAAYLSCAEFVKATGSMIYLLNRKYMPFYKWMFRGMDHLEKLSEIKGMLEKLITIPDTPKNMVDKTAAIEEICLKVTIELNKQKILTGSDVFLASHCQEVMNSISDPQIRNLPIMY